MLTEWLRHFGGIHRHQQMVNAEEKIIEALEEAMSPLSRDLMQLAREIETSDELALAEEDIERELEQRRGGYVADGKQNPHLRCRISFDL